MAEPQKRRGPWQIMWAKLRHNRAAMLGLYVLILLYSIIIFAGFLSPYDYTTQFRARNWHPPQITRLHLWDAKGDWHGPFVYGTTKLDELAKEGRLDRWRFLIVQKDNAVASWLESDGVPLKHVTTAEGARAAWEAQKDYDAVLIDGFGDLADECATAMPKARCLLITSVDFVEDRSKVVPIDFFVKGAPYSFLGVGLETHLYGSAVPENPVFMLGSDRLGRDLTSRIFYGGRISLSIGLVGILISMSLGMLIGGIAGYFGGFTDFALMRFVELILSIPGLYLILTVQQAFGRDLPSTQTYFIMVFVLAFVGWAANGRVIRGMVLAIKENDYVVAAEALGLSRLRVICVHILPNTLSFVIVTATIAVPYYILGEVALSFLGVGIQEPAASWGNMLRDAQNVRYLTDYQWVVLPGFFIFVAVMAYNFLGDGLRDAADPRSLEA